MKEENIDHSAIKLDENDSQKRRKRATRDDEFYKHDDKQQYYVQKKRNLSIIPSTRSQHLSRQNSDDQDDETLIRETQAALKSLSGSWPDSRPPLYKINDQDENPAFQNLFDIQNSNRKMSPAISTTANQMFTDCTDYAPYKDGYAGKYKMDSKNLQRFRRDKDDFSIKFRSDGTKYQSQYPSHDFNELVDDSSNDLQVDMASGGAHKSELGGNIERKAYTSEDKLKELTKTNDLYANYANHRNTVPFSQSSAFRPLNDSKRLSGIGMPMTNPYLHADTSYGTYVSDIAGVLTDNDSKDKKFPVKEEDITKPVDSPDSKHYTILQPAGVGSKAASVMQDIAREGVVSVAAVSSVNSPGLNNVTSTTALENKQIFERPMQSFSPGSNSKGN